jgi:8-oxo-dGTP diphosphatase
MKDATAQSIMRFLGQDRIRNLNIINFMEHYPLLSVERIGNAVLLRGVSDCRWVYISCPDESALDVVVSRLGDDDMHFAALEDWMVPGVMRDRTLDWKLSMIRLILPQEVEFPEAPLPHVGPLSPEDAEHIYANSIYRKVTTPEFIRDRIQAGPSAGVRESGTLVAWLMTQDDGSIGVLHVLDQYRRRGFARDLTVYLIGKVRAEGKVPYVHVEEGNLGSMALALGIGFRKDRRLCWLSIRESGAASRTDNYC